MLKPKTRRYLYRVGAAALGYAAVKGLVSGEERDALLLLGSALFGVADYNVDPDA